MRSICHPSSCVRSVVSSARARRGVHASVVAGLLGLAGLGGGCNPAKSPPSLPVVVAAPVRVPTPVMPADAEMFGYLRVDNVQGLIRRVGGAQVEQLATQRGINLAELQPGAPLVAFLWDPQGATPQEAPVVVLAPIAADSGIASLVKGLSPAVQATAVGATKTSTALTLGAAAQARVNTDGAALLALAQQKAPFELTLFVNATPIMAKYGPMLRLGLAAMGPMLAMNAPQNPAAPSPKSTLAMLEQMLTTVEELQTFTLGTNVTDSALELSLVTTQKGGATGGPLAVPDLARFVPPGDVKLQWNTRDFKKTLDWYLRVYGSFLDEKPELKAQVNAMIADWTKAGRSMQTAASMSFRSTQGLTMHGIMRVENGPAALAAIRRSVQLFASGPVHDMYKQMGVELVITSKQNVRKIKGNPVDRYEYTVKTNPDQQQLDPAAKAMFAKFSGISYEVLQTGPYLVYAMGAPVESVAEALFSGQGPYPMAAMKTFPAGGSLYMELDLAQLLEWMKSLVPAGSPVKMPTLPAQGSVVSLWSYDSGATSYQKAVIPTQLLQNLAAGAR